MSKHEALSQIVTLAHQHGITARDINIALAGDKPRGSIAMRLFSYLGGIFIFAGISAFIALMWNELNSPARVIITLGSGFCVYIMGVIFSRDPARANILAPVMVVAAMLQTCGLFVTIDEYFNNHTNNWRLACLIVFGLMLIQQGFTFISLRLPILLFNTVAFGAMFAAVAFDMLGVRENINAMTIGGSLMLIAYGLRDSTQYRFMLPLGYFAGSVMFLVASFDLFERTPFEILYLGITCFFIFVSVTAQSTTLLVTSVFAMLCFIGYFTARHFIDSIGWPIALILLGILFFAISAGAVRLKKKYFVN